MATGLRYDGLHSLDLLGLHSDDLLDALLLVLWRASESPAVG